LVFKDGHSIIKEIKSGKISPIYLLHGAEGYHIDLVSDYIENHLLNDSEKAFNQQIVYGKDMHIDQVVDYARQFPMMAERRVLIVKEAQTMDMKTSDGMSAKFTAYVSSPSPTTVLVLAFKNKKADGKFKWVKLIKDQHTLLESVPVKEYQMMPWIKNYLKDRGHNKRNRCKHRHQQRL